MVMVCCANAEMTSLLRYLTHPQVRIDPHVPVREWGLSPGGRHRTLAAAKNPALRRTTLVVASGETKAIETADLLSAQLELVPVICDAMHENDRSSTGFLPPSEFEAMADAFFANPDQSVSGWERALDAQARIVRETAAVLGLHRDGEVLLVGHGAVGTLLYCHFADLPISRRYDQGHGGGCFFAIELETKKPLHHWKPMEDL